MACCSLAIICCTGLWWFRIKRTWTGAAIAEEQVVSQSLKSTVVSIRSGSQE